MPTQSPTAKLAKLFGCSQRRVQQLIKDGIISKPTDDPADIAKCIQEYIAHLKKQLDNSSTRKGVGQYKLKIAKEQALKLALENQERQASLLPKQEVEQEVGNAFMNVRTRLLSIPSKAAPEVFGIESRAEIESLLKRLVHEALNELASCAYGNKDISKKEA